MAKIVDKRLQCPCCSIRTWMTDYKAFMLDHDRPDGRRCLKAQKQVLATELRLKEMGL